MRKSYSDQTSLTGYISKSFAISMVLSQLINPVVAFVYYYDGVTIVRKGVLNGEFIIEILGGDVLFIYPSTNTMVQYRYYSDGVDTFRDGVRNGSYVIDKALTALGFDGEEDTDWENLVF